VLLEALMEYPAPSSSSRTTAISSTSWPREFLKSATAKVEVYPGNYEDYLWRKQGGSAKQDETIRQQLKAPEAPPAPATETSHPETLHRPRQNV